MSRKPHKPTADTRNQAETLSGYGVPQYAIADLLGIDAKTLRKYYEKELAIGKAKANAKIAQSLFNKAINGDTASAIFWAKTQMGWKETERHEHTGADGKPLEWSLQPVKADAKS